MRAAEKILLLQLLDQAWKEHLLHLDHLRQGINLRAYAQRDPLNEYKREAFELFEGMLSHLRETVTTVLSYVEMRVNHPEDMEPEPVSGFETRYDPALAPAGAAGDPDGALPDGMVHRVAPAAVSAVGEIDPRTPRNAMCPCGSGKKYKHCHGRVA